METCGYLAIALAVTGAVGCISVTADDDDSAQAGLENCLSAGDEDANGLSDCDDAACAGRFDCQGKIVAASDGIYRHWLPQSPANQSRPLQFDLEYADFDQDGLLDFSFSRGGIAGTSPVHSVLVVLSSGVAEGQVIDVEAEGIEVAASPVQSSLAPAAIPCDVDNDGTQDLIVLDSVPTSGGGQTFARAALSGVSAQTPVPAGVADASFGRIFCLGNVDGDPGDEVLVELVRPTGVVKLLLNGDSLLQGLDLASQALRVWESPIDSPRSARDMNADGLSELLFPHSGAPVEVDGEQLQLEGWILPGQSGMSVRDTTITTISGESQSPVAVLLRSGSSGPSAGSLDLLDLDGDGQPEITVLAALPEGGAALMAFSSEGVLATGASEVILDPLNALTQISIPGGDSARFGRFRAGDLNGDGFPDLVVPLVDFSLVPTADEEWGTGGDQFQGIAVFMGTGDVAAFSRRWWAADVVVLSDQRDGGAPESVLPVVGGIAYWSHPVRADFDDLSSDGFGSAGVFTTSALLIDEE